MKRVFCYLLFIFISLSAISASWDIGNPNPQKHIRYGEWDRPLYATPIVFTPPIWSYVQGQVISSQYTGDGHDHLIVSANYAANTDGLWYSTDVSFYCEYLHSSGGFPNTHWRAWGWKTWTTDLEPYATSGSTEWILNLGEVFNTHGNGIVNSGDVQVGETY